MNPADNTSFLLLAAALPGLLALGSQLLGGWWFVQRKDDARRRARFADGLSAVVAYLEFPFVVRRRRASAPEDERIRISTELRGAQERLAFHSAWLRTESPRVACAYDALVAGARRVAGAEIRRAWETEPIARDDQMSIGGIDLSAVAPLRVAYLEAVRAQFSWRRFVPTRPVYLSRLAVHFGRVRRLLGRGDGIPPS